MHIASLSCLEREAYFTFSIVSSAVLMKSELAGIRLKERKVASSPRKHQMYDTGAGGGPWRDLGTWNGWQQHPG